MLKTPEMPGIVGSRPSSSTSTGGEKKGYPDVCAGWPQIGVTLTLYMRPELPHLLVQLIAQVLQLVGGHFLHLALVQNALPHPRAHHGEAVSHEFEHVLVGKKTGGKFP